MTNYNYVVVVGTVKDLSFLIDVLPAYIFPRDERIIGEWVLAGFSLGGHATWLGLTHGTSSQSSTINSVDDYLFRAKDTHRRPDLRLRGLLLADGAARR